MGWGQDLPSTCGGSRVRYGVSGQPSSIFEWEVTGGTVLNNYNDSIDIEWELTEGIKTLKVTEHTQGNCVATPVFAHVMISSSKFDIGDKIEICEGETHTFIPNKLFTAYKWSTGATTPDISVTTPGTYWLEASDGSGCKGIDSAELVVNPTLKIDLGKDTALCPEQRLLLDAGTNGAKYQWSTNDIGSMLEIGEGKQTIWVDVTTDKGCVTRDSINIAICDYANWIKDFDIPNAFTPNGDNDNDTWKLEWLNFFPQATIEIYDRWGRMVFRSKGFPSEGWNGKSNGKPLPMDSYHFIINIESGVEPIVGNVTIIR